MSELTGKEGELAPWGVNISANASIDKLRIAAEYTIGKKEKVWQEWLPEVVAYIERDAPLLEAYRSAKRAMYYPCFTLEGGIWVGLVNKSCFPYIGHDLEIELNPNKLTERGREVLQELLKRTSQHKITRIDPAIDYVGLEGLGEIGLDPSTTIRNNSNKNIKIFFGRGNKLESVNVGTRGNNSAYCRHYNKTAETLKSKGKKQKPILLNEDTGEGYITSDYREAVETTPENWWRVEIEERRSEMLEQLNKGKLPGNIFDIVKPEGWVDFTKLEGVTKLVVKRLVEHPEDFADLDKNTKTKYKKLIAECATQLPEGLTPSEIWRRDLETTAIQLNELLLQASGLGPIQKGKD